MSLITLINPSMTVVRLVQSRSTTPPIGIAYLAGNLRQAGHDVEVVDAVGENIFQILSDDSGKNFYHGLSIDETVKKINPETEYIGVSCQFSIEWPYTRRVLKKIREKFQNVPIIIGGEHVTATADYILKEIPEAVDYCVIGEGENKLLTLINTLDIGGHVPEGIGIFYNSKDKFPIVGESDTKAINQGIDLLDDIEGSSKPWNDPQRPLVTSNSNGGTFTMRDMRTERVKNIDDIPLPAWDLIPLNQYLDNGFGYGVENGRTMPMLASRGCPFQCTFCSSPQMWTTKWVARDPDLLLDEMEMYLEKYNIENFSFYDLTAIVKKDWIIHFCKKIEERGLKFTWQLPSGTRSEAIDEEVAKYLYVSGMRNMNYAPESGSRRTLKRIKKNCNLKSMKKSMRGAVKNKLVIKCNFIMGFPHDTHLDIWKSFAFITKLAILGVHEVTQSMYVPYPGTEIADELIKTGVLPAYTDEYFDHLHTKGNFFANQSYSDNISDRALTYYLLFGALYFLSLSMLIRPWRLFEVVYNVLFNKPDKYRLEGTIRAVFGRGGRGIKNLFRAKRDTPTLGHANTRNRRSSLPT